MIRTFKLPVIGLIISLLLFGCAEKEKDYYCNGKDIFVVGDSVFIVGSKCQRTSETDVPTLWINGEAYEVGKMGNFNKATSVFVDDGDVYVTVTESDQQRAFLWKNGSVQMLGKQEANSVVVKDGTTYVVGQHNDMPTLWTNGKAEPLSFKPGSANSICLNGDDIYVVGYTGDYFNGKATLWKNGNEIPLSNYPSLAHEIVIEGDDIYIAGEELRNPAIWKNGDIQRLSFKNDNSSAYSVAVSDGTVFVTGIRGFNVKGSPQYGIWKNGNLIDVSEDMRGEIVSVKINNNKVYFTGSSKNMLPLWTIDLN